MDDALSDVLLQRLSESPAVTDGSMSAGSMSASLDQDHEAVIAVEEREVSEFLETLNNRVVGVDVLRGVCVALMIFVDECGDDYPEWIGHSAWDGLRLADIVMPWFLFVVGVSIGISNKSFKNGIRVQMIRGLKLYLLGFALQGGSPFEGKTPFGYDLRQVRFCGILNRIGFGFSISWIIEFVWSQSSHSGLATWLSHCAIQAVVLSATFGLHVETWTSTWGSLGDQTNSIKLDPNSSFAVICNTRGHITSPECTASAFFDRAIFGQDHLQVWFSTRMDICSDCSPHFCPKPLAPRWCFAHMYDPEGALSSFSSVLSVKIGIETAGWVKNRESKHLPFLVGLALCILSVGLDTFGLRINKQLYSLSYIFITSGGAIVALMVCIKATEGVIRLSSPIASLAVLGQQALFIFILHGPFELIADLIYISHSLNQQFPRHNIMSFLRKDIFRNEGLLFALFKTSVFIAIAHIAQNKNFHIKI